MAVLRNRASVAMFFCFLLCFLFGCVQKGPGEDTQAKMEIWDLRITGEAKGTSSMFIWQSKSEENLYHVKAEFNAKIREDKYGGGKVACKGTGKIRNNHLVATFNGSADMLNYDEIGAVSVFVDAVGTFTSLKGSGTWKATHRDGYLEGKWSATRVK
ncbi:hypothetical protein ACFL4N_06955 [Thermodesulfobacteriota bacterium]